MTEQSGVLHPIICQFTKVATKKKKKLGILPSKSNEYLEEVCPMWKKSVGFNFWSVEVLASIDGRLTAFSVETSNLVFFFQTN